MKVKVRYFLDLHSFAVETTADDVNNARDFGDIELLQVVKFEDGSVGKLYRLKPEFLKYIASKC